MKANLVKKFYYSNTQILTKSLFATLAAMALKLNAIGVRVLCIVSIFRLIISNFVSFAVKRAIMKEVY